MTIFSVKQTPTVLTYPCVCIGSLKDRLLVFVNWLEVVECYLEMINSYLGVAVGQLGVVSDPMKVVLNPVEVVLNQVQAQA